MKTHVLLITVCLMLCAAGVAQDSTSGKKFACQGQNAASSLGIVTLTVNTHSETALGEAKQLGHVEIGRIGDVVFMLHWLPYAHQVGVARYDDDGFQAIATGPDSGMVMLSVKRPNHDKEKTNVGCIPR